MHASRVSPSESPRQLGPSLDASEEPCCACEGVVSSSVIAQMAAMNARVRFEYRRRRCGVLQTRHGPNRVSGKVVPAINCSQRGPAAVGRLRPALDPPWIVTVAVFASDPARLVFDYEFGVLGPGKFSPRLIASDFRSCNESARCVPSVWTAHRPSGRGSTATCGLRAIARLLRVGVSTQIA